MRVISGKLKARIIAMPKLIRPTSDKVREALFEILKNCIEGSNFLDLYSGSGAIGIEAFSRGAKSVAFVDNNFRCIEVLKDNLAKCGISDLSTIYIYNREALSALKLFEKKGFLFDIIFLDPPYYKDMARNTLIAISKCDILRRNAIVILETYKKENLDEEAGFLKKFRSYRYGDTKLEFFRNKNEKDSDLSRQF